MAAYEAHLISEAYSLNEGNAARAAASLGIPLRTFNEKRARRGLADLRKRRSQVDDDR
jgi:two-component system C4-dicarboxylate transport response regulator DctD